MAILEKVENKKCILFGISLFGKSIFKNGCQESVNATIDNMYVFIII